VDCSEPERTIVSWTVKKNMSVTTQLDCPPESQAYKNRPLRQFKSLIIFNVACSARNVDRKAMTLSNSTNPALLDRNVGVQELFEPRVTRAAMRSLPGQRRGLPEQMSIVRSSVQRVGTRSSNLTT